MMLKTTVGKILYQKRKMLLWWVIGIMAMTIFTLSFFPTFRDSQITEAFSQLPAAVQRLAGDVSAYETIEGYIKQQIFALRLPLLTIILAIALFAGLSAGDEQSGKLETQLTLPISRTQLLVQKLIAGMIILAIACASIAIAVQIGTRLVHESYGWGDTFMASFACFVLSAVIGLIAFMIGSVTGNKGLTLGLSSGVAFGSYLITSMAASVSSLELLDKISLFHYYPGGPDVTLFQTGVFAVLALVCTAVSVVVFNRRDLKV